jgi:hypothetical protein
MALDYKQCINGIADLKEKALELYDSSKNSILLKPKDKLFACSHTCNRSRASSIFNAQRRTSSNGAQNNGRATKLSKID